MATNFYAKTAPQSPSSGGGVTSLNSETGAVTITGGTGITITTPTSSTIQVASSSAGDVTVGAFSATPTAAGLTINGSQVLNMDPADGTHPGGVSIAAQTIAGQKTFSSNPLIPDGALSTPGIAFSGDTNTGLYRVGADQASLVAGGKAGLEVRLATSTTYSNIGMGGAASLSDSYPLLIQRSNTSVGTYLQIANPATDASSKASLQLSTDNGGNTGEFSVFTAATATAAYADSLVVRPSDGTARLSLIGGDEATGHVTTYTGGTYTSAGEAVRINADKSIQAMQQIATPATPAASSAKLYQKSDGRFYQLSAAGTERLLGTSDTTGTVTSVAMSVPSVLSISGSPITGSGTLAVSYSGTALPVANGGTALTSGTSGGVLAYTASGTLASSAALAQYAVVLGGGAGAVPATLAADASTVKWLKSGGSSANPAWTLHTAPTTQVFVTGTAATYTIPAGCVGLKVTVTAGGGGGGGSITISGTAAGGGGAGGTSIKHLAVTAGNTLTYSVGAAGTSGASGATGGTGGVSSVSSGTQTITTITTSGGLGGVGNATTSGVAGGVGGAAGSGGDINEAGGAGMSSVVVAAGAAYTSGNGGASFWGGGGNGVATASGGGGAGASYGSGGGGGSSAGGGDQAGGAGKVGIIVFEEYY